LWWSKNETTFLPSLEVSSCHLAFLGAFLAFLGAFRAFLGAFRAFLVVASSTAAAFAFVFVSSWQPIAAVFASSLPITTPLGLE
jgi:hypothetical protein